VVAARVARVLSASASLATKCVIEEVSALAQASFARARLIACGAEDWPIVAEWRASTAPRSYVLLWTAENDRALIDRSAKDGRIVAIVGWPKFLSTPRLWEVGQAARRELVSKSVPTLEQLLAWGAATRAWTPGESGEIEAIVNDVRAFAEAANAHPRIAERVGEAAYELLMNAVYDAPTLADGTPRYAMDRTAAVTLEDWERPSLVCATDGVRLALQCTDPFGWLQRWHVFESVSRGLSALSAFRGIHGETDPADEDSLHDVSVSITQAKSTFNARLNDLFGSDHGAHAPDGGLTSIRQDFLSLADGMMCLIRDASASAAMRKELEVARAV
jgi:hypothetical protein